MNRSAKLFTIASLLVFAFIIFKSPHRSWTGLQVLGLTLMICGLVGMAIARYQLGNSFTIRPEARALVTHGIYSKIRNPVYVSGTVLIAGLILYVNRPRWFWCFLILIPLQIVRARAEAKVLEERFGKAYRQYRARTWF
jgi:protein-S-isoprenylcysteine O-methyltransferase Ste14